MKRKEIFVFPKVILRHEGRELNKDHVNFFDPRHSLFKSTLVMWRTVYRKRLSLISDHIDI